MLPESRLRGHQLPLVATTFVVVIIGSLLLLHRGSADSGIGPERSDGPLDLPTEWSMTTIPISLDETAVWGHVVATNKGKEDITLTSAEMLPATGTGEGQAVSVFAAGTDRGVFSVGADRVLPKQHLTPIPGTVVPSTPAGKDRGVDIIFQVRAEKPGRVVYDRVRVTYRSGARSFEEVTSQGLTVCADLKQPKPEKCTAD
jgi:hypothetical protein